MPHLLEEDIEAKELLAKLRLEWRTSLDQGVAPIRRDIEDLKGNFLALGQRMSRPPGFGPDHALLEGSPFSLARQLSDDAGFQNWIKSNKVPSSGYATELRLPTSRKAAVPVTNLSPTQHVGGIYGAPQMPLRLRALMPTIPVLTGSIEYTQETSFTPSAAVVPEGTTKPTMVVTYAEATAKVATIASVVKASVQALADTPMLALWLDNRLLYSCSLKEEDVILNGDAGNAITGLMGHATAFAYVPATGDTGMDVIGHAIGKLMGQGYQPDGLVLSADDFTALRLLKTTIGNYVFLGTASSAPDDESLVDTSMWAVPLVVSPSMPTGQFLVGAFQQSTILFSRESVNVQIAFQNEDDFVKNMVCLRGELRSGGAVPVPAGLLKGTLPAITTQASKK
jgi:HK97 family phage major capsid protein